MVRSGLVQSLARPGGNITGLTWDVGDEFRAKRLELLKEMQLRISRMAVLWEPPKRHQAAIDMGASALGVETRWFQWSGDIARDLADIAQWRADVLYVYGSPRAVQRRVELNKLALQLRLPTAYPGAVFVEDGGLMSYGPNAPDLFRRAATYVDKILKGAKPVDLPVERPRQIDFVINLKTAKALGLTIPHSILLRADRVIE